MYVCDSPDSVRFWLSYSLYLNLYYVLLWIFNVCLYIYVISI